MKKTSCLVIFDFFLFNSLIFDRWSIWTAQLQQHDKRTTKKNLPNDWRIDQQIFHSSVWTAPATKKKLNIYRHSWFDLLNARNDFYENFDKVSIYDDHDHYWIISWLSLQKQFECLIFILFFLFFVLTFITNIYYLIELMMMMMKNLFHLWSTKSITEKK